MCIPIVAVGQIFEDIFVSVQQQMAPATSKCWEIVENTLSWTTPTREKQSHNTFTVQGKQVLIINTIELRNYFKLENPFILTENLYTCQK